MSAPDEDGLDEVGAALRERLHQAVSSVEPGPGTLEYLRRAVPARRRRRNAALAATAVSVFAVSAGATLAARGSFDARPSAAGGSNVGNLMTTGTNDAPGGGSGHGGLATPGGQDMSASGSAATEPPSSSAAAPGSPKPSQPATSPSATPSGSQLAVLCQNSSVSSVVATQSSVNSGITYETFVGTAKSACTLAGMPGLTVFAAGGGPARVPVYKADQTVAPLLPAVPAGQTLTLQAGDRFEFQIAWAPSGCSPNPTPTTPPSSVPPTTGSPTSTATSSGPTPSGPTSVPTGPTSPSGTPSSSAPSPAAYTVAYSVSGTQPTQSVSFTASCGAAVYVTNYFQAPGQRRESLPPTPTVSTR